MTSFTDISLLGMLGWMPGHWEIILIVLVILLLFGGKKLPELARGLAKGMRLFKDEIKGVKDSVDDVGEDVKNIGNDVKNMKESQSPENQSNQQNQS